MKKRTKVALVGAGAVAAALTTAGIASAGGADDHEAPITGQELERATAAALDHTGEGKVTETEVGDEESYYEVEVTLPDGTQIDVQLDRQFNVVGDETDSESETEGGTDD